MGQLEQMIAYQRAHGMLEDMSNDRAAEMEARKPNMRRPQVLLNSIPAKLEGLKGGGKAGLMRVVGGAKKMNRGEEAAAKYLAMAEKEMVGRGMPKLDIHEMDEDSASACSEEGDMKGGFLPMLAAIGLPLLGKLFGSGKKPLKRKEAHAMGRELGQHIKTLHGEGFLDDLVSGIGSVVGKIFGAGSPAGEAASDSAMAVYSKGVAPRRTVPNGIDSKAQQAPDYAPKWFRESGDIAGGGMYGRGAMEEKAGKEFRHAALKAHKLAHKALAVEGMGASGGAKEPFRTMGYEQTKKVMAEVEKAKAARKAMSGAGVSGGKRVLSDRQKARNALVKQIMAEKGMKMTDASRYIKEHDLF